MSEALPTVAQARLRYDAAVQHEFSSRLSKRMTPEHLAEHVSMLESAWDDLMAALERERR